MSHIKVIRKYLRGLIMKNRLTIAIQKGGRLSDQSRDLIKKSGINFSTKADKLLAKSNNLPIDILFVRDDDIPSFVKEK